MCTFRASCCSARLSRAQVPGFAGSTVRDREKKGGGSKRGACSGGYKGVRADRPELVAGGGLQINTNIHCYLQLYGIRYIVTDNSDDRKEGNVLFNDALNTFYLRLYGVRHMVKNHSDSEKGNPLPPHRLLFPINSKGSFICTIPQTG